MYYVLTRIVLLCVSVDKARLRRCTKQCPGSLAQLPCRHRLACACRTQSPSAICIHDISAKFPFLHIIYSI